MARLQEAEIRARIKQSRELAGLNQNELADLLGVIPRTVQNYEATDGQRAKVPWDRLGDIADITQTTLYWLLHGDDENRYGGEILEKLRTIERLLDRLVAQPPSWAQSPTGDEQEAMDQLAGADEQLAPPGAEPVNSPAERERDSRPDSGASGA